MITSETEHFFIYLSKGTSFHLYFLSFELHVIVPFQFPPFPVGMVIFFLFIGYEIFIYSEYYYPLVPLVASIFLLLLYFFSLLSIFSVSFPLITFSFVVLLVESCLKGLPSVSVNKFIFQCILQFIVLFLVCK